MNITITARACVATAVVLLWAKPDASAAEITCIKCHDKVLLQQYAASAHAQAGISCLDCHGGDPKITDETAHVTDNFFRPSNKKEIAESCAKCHSDVRRMNPYGIPTDQLDRYKTSKHGEQLYQKNDKNVATCTDCHGVHDIMKVKSPDARVFPTKIPDTCGRCHSDAKLMAQYKLPSDVVAKYKTSHHAHMLFDKGDLSAPTCITCHGNHGATPPGTAQVSQVCGKCHGRQRELFEQSVHAALPADKFNKCVSCHGNHAIQKASIALYDEACNRCHASQPKALAVRDAVAGFLRTAHNALDSANARVQEATTRGLATEDEQLMLQEASTQVTQLEAMQHTLSADALRPAVKQANQTTWQIIADVTRLEKIERFKRVSLVPTAIFLGLMGLLFGLKRAQIDRRKGDAASQTSRRSFLDWLLGSGLVLWLVAIVAPIIAFVWPAQRRGPGAQTVSAGKADDFADWQTKIVAVNGQPIIVIRTPQGFRAFSAICTHLGCIVNWDAARKQIACPCHAGLFDINGRPVAGPPPRPLKEHGVAVVNKEVMVKSA